MIESLLTHAFWSWMTGLAGAVGFLAAVAFVVKVFIETGWSWWRNPFGRYLMTRKILLVTLFVVILMNRIGPDWWELARSPVTAVLMTAFALQTFVPYRLLMKAQNQAQHDQEARR